MTSIPAGIATESAILRQNVALSTIKQSHDMEQRVVEIIDEAAQNSPLNATRGTNIDITV